MITDITVKLQRLLDGYLDQDVDKEVYRTEKSKLLSEKKSLEEEISRNQKYLVINKSRNIGSNRCQSG